jgi:hypothetical protein
MPKTRGQIKDTFQCKDNLGELTFSIDNFVQREIDKLASLCTEKGANEEEIAHCRIKREWRHLANYNFLLFSRRDAFVMQKHISY